MSGGLIPLQPGIDHISFECLGPGYFSLEHLSIRVPQPIWATLVSVWQQCWFFQVSRQLLSTAFDAITEHFPKSLDVPRPNPTVLLKTVMSSPVSSLLRYRTPDNLVTCIPSILPECGVWVRVWRYPSTPTEILACFATLVLWGLCRSETVIPRKKVFFIFIGSARAGGKTELVPFFDFVSVKWLRTHLGRNSLQRRQLDRWSKAKKKKIVLMKIKALVVSKPGVKYRWCRCKEQVGITVWWAGDCRHCILIASGFVFLISQ